MKKPKLVSGLLMASLHEAGEMTRFGGRFFKEVGKKPFEFRELLRQAFTQGYKSLPLVATTAFILGLVLTIQLRPTLVEFGAESWLPKMVSIAIVREIGPMLTALICAGRISSGIGAELGSMRVTEQIDAMEVSGAHPYRYVVVTRILATTLTVPLLTIIADAISLHGSFLAVNIRGQLTMPLFYHQVFKSLAYKDVYPGIVKTFFFGFAIGVVGCYKGYYSKGGTEGVGHAANSAVVTASLMVFIIDLLAAQISDFFDLV